MFTSFRARVAAFLLLGCTAGVANAIPITFTYDPSTSSASFTDASGFCLGCAPTAEVRDTELDFTLDAIGDAFTIDDFITVAVDGLFGTGFALGNGSATLNATLGFSAPSAATSSSATGSGSFESEVVGFVSWFIPVLGQNGSIIWDSQPGELVFSDGTAVALEFGGGSASCTGFQCLGGISTTLGATTTLTAVPEPGILALLGIGVVGVAMTSRRRRSKATV